MRYILPIVLVVLASAGAMARGGESSLGAAARGVRSPDAAVAASSADELRRAGPDGLRALLAEYDRRPDAGLIPEIDAVAGQKDAVWSRLYWYTDLEQAKAAAKADGKPILYLRMLGKLTDEYSCANSRFFRTVLYANESVSKLLREKFVLVWESERPVPVVTVDYGDGRVLKRTLTGNSAHYVLDSDGRVMDALPGLFDPVKFERIVRAAGEAATAPAYLRARYTAAAQRTVEQDWQRDVGVAPAALRTDKPARGPGAPPDAAAAVGIAPSKSGGGERAMLHAMSPQFARELDKPDAAQAARRAEGKRFVEAPMLRAMSPEFARELADPANADAATWSRVAAMHIGDARLDARSIALIRSQNERLNSNPGALSRTVDQFQRSIAEDSVRNYYNLRRQVLGWLRVQPTVPLEDLNRRVYAELFLTPATDPWLGLAPEGTYTALTNDGCRAPAAP